MAVTVAALVGYAGLTAVAQASIPATASATQAVSSVSWKLVPSTTTNPVTTGAATVTGSLLSGPQYLYVVNTGTANLATGYTGTYGITAAGLAVGYMNVNACTGVWNETTGACVGGSVRLLASTSSSQTPVSNPPLPTAPGGTLRLQVSFVGVNVVSNGTVAVSVSRTAAAGTTTTS